MLKILGLLIALLFVPFFAALLDFSLFRLHQLRKGAEASKGTWEL